LIRLATLADADAVARVHASSCRTAYRRLLSADYLNGDVDAERRDVCQERFREPSQDRVVFVAEDDGHVVGFVSISMTAGTPPRTSKICTSCPSTGAADSANSCSPPPRAGRSIARLGAALYLWVFEENVAARGFYRALGAIETKRARRPLPDGSHHPAVQCEWLHPSAL
jgi:hypothetical protein